MSNKNYRVNIGTVKGAAFWNEPKEQGKQGYYSITISRSVKDQQGQWIESKINLFPNEMVALSAILEKLARVVLQPQSFEVVRNDGNNGYAAPVQAPVQQAAPASQQTTYMGDDIPF